MGLLNRISDIWLGGPQEEALRMIDDFRFEYASYLNLDDMHYVYDLINDRQYEEAFYAIQEYSDVIHEADMRLILRLLQEANMEYNI